MITNVCACLENANWLQEYFCLSLLCVCGVHSYVYYEDFLLIKNSFLSIFKILFLI